MRRPQWFGCFMLLFMWTIVWSQEDIDVDLTEGYLISKGLNRQYSLLPEVVPGIQYRHISLTVEENGTYFMSYEKKGKISGQIKLDQAEFFNLQSRLDSIKYTDSEALSYSYYRRGPTTLVLLGIVQGAYLGYLTDITGSVAFFHETFFYTPLVPLTLGISNLVLAQNSYVRPAMTQMNFIGGLAGYVHGIQLNSLLRPSEFTFSEKRSLGSALLITGFTLGESIAGHLIAKKHNYSRLEGNLFTSASILGNFMGYQLGLLTGLHRALPVFTGMAGYVAGGYIGPKLIKLSDRTVYDYEFIKLSTLVGTALGYSLSLETLQPNMPLVSLYTIFGTLSGLSLGVLFTRDTYFEKSNIFRLSVYSGVGALVGAAAWLPLAEVSRSPISVIGTMAAAGFAAGYYSILRDKKISSKKDKNIGYHFNINPLGLSGLISNQEITPNNAMWVPPTFQWHVTF